MTVDAPLRHFVTPFNDPARFVWSSLSRCVPPHETDVLNTCINLENEHGERRLLCLRYKLEVLLMRLAWLESNTAMTHVHIGAALVPLRKARVRALAWLESLDAYRHELRAA